MFLIEATLGVVKLYLTVALVCISLMTNDTEDLFKSLLVICYTCFGEMSIVFLNSECYNRIP